MHILQRQWQTSIHKGENGEDVVIGYGETLKLLAEAAAGWLDEYRPTFFYSTSREYRATPGGQTYFYSNGTEYKALLGADFLGEGWYIAGPWIMKRHIERQSVTKLGDFESVIDHYIKHSLLPEKGPDYQESAVADGILQLHMIRTVLNEVREDLINSYLQRGWYIIGLGHRVTTDGDQYITYALGHPEEKAR